MFQTAITRKPGSNFASGLTTIQDHSPDYERILQQHAAYVKTLRDLGLNVIVLESLSDFPDAYFVEDVAVLTPNRAVITSPGAPTREGETKYITKTLSEYRELAYIQPPGSLDGGDVMIVEDHYYIGISQRTNQAGANQLGKILKEEGLGWTPVKVSGGLHLKSDVNYLGNSTLILAENMARKEVFASFNQIMVDNEEANAANTLLVNDTLLTPKGSPKTVQKLIENGFTVISLDISEVQKMDGGLSCMSLRL